MQPLPPLPAAALRNAAPTPDESSLQGPDYLDRRPKDATAPLSEFIAAFLMLVLLGLMVAGAALGEPLLFQIGLFVLGGGAVLYAIGKIRAMARGVRRPSTGLDWGSFFFGGFARSGRRRIEEAEAEERKRRGWDNPDSFRR